MSNYCTIKSTIVLEETLLVKDAKTVIVSAKPRSTGTVATAKIMPLLVASTLWATTMTLIPKVHVRKIVVVCVKAMDTMAAAILLWQSCTNHNWNHPDYCKLKGSSPYHPQDQAPWASEGAHNRHNLCHSCSRSCSCDCHDHRDWNHKQLCVTTKARVFMLGLVTALLVVAWSHSCGSRRSSCNLRLYIHDDDKWDWKQDHNPFHKSNLKKKCWMSLHWTISPLVQVLAAPVVSKPTTDTKDQNDHPVSDITAPKNPKCTIHKLSYTSAFFRFKCWWIFGCKFRSR